MNFNYKIDVSKVESKNDNIIKNRRSDTKSEQSVNIT